MFIEIKRTAGQVLYLNCDFIHTVFIEDPSKKKVAVYVNIDDSYTFREDEYDQFMDQLKRIQNPLIRIKRGE